MTGVLENADIYLAGFDELEKRSADSPRWVRRLRKRAMERFTQLGFPTSRLEEWKFTSVMPIVRTRFQPAAENGRDTGRAAMRAPTPRLVFVNGRHAPDLSNLEGLPACIKCMSLSAAMKRGEAAVEEHLARYADYQDHAFAALNTAFLEDGAFVEIPKGTVLLKPLYLVFVSTASDDRPAMIHPRNLILVGSESQASIVETYLGAGNGTYFNNAVTELATGESAVVEHYKLQEENERAFHVATAQFQQARSTSLTAHSVALGGALVRNDVNSVLGGEGAECVLNGLYVTRGEQHVDNHTVLDHAKPHCGSREYYKGILDGRSSAVFNGGIVVRKDAQKTDAIQSNKNLLLSEEAVINTKPQLQIWADDVRCTHGATIGQLDSEAVFYLRSRGIAHEEARRLLTYAFANDVIGRMKVEPIRLRLEQELFARLSGGRSRL